ncbi:hypothetical protein M8542_48030 [Amycolatopsis sp. OK19-0408]|uniref:Uncharacterized protein n=1 Tax=Amycolatopsis iheyensis TaxID=2945988 RepID=A0A9X2NKM8_9PSEU|nr:hypothetical protein [Amycolatopsis iheyensis]MCR6490576.1 hypothetical protein [Amycolatopsis iheyensis]
MTLDHGELNEYLLWVNEEAQTAKISSELKFRSPPRERLRANDRFVRALVTEEVAWSTSAGAHHEFGELTESQLRAVYWEAAERARTTAVSFGAAGHRTLDEYFAVDPSRSEEAALARARGAITPHSPADYLLRTIDEFSVSTGTGPARACRQAMSLLAQGWEGLISERSRGRASSVLRAADLLRAFHETAGSPTPRRRQVEQLPSRGRTDSSPVLLTTAEAREFSTLYMLGKYPFTTKEYEVAGDLVALPRLRSAMLAAHLHFTASSAKPLAELLSAWGTPRVLLPFTEAFVGRTGPGAPLSPNPKLITVLCNNVVPAMAGELIRRGLPAAALDSRAVHAGVVSAKRRHIFSLAVAMFDRFGGPLSSTVRISGFSMRACPALVPFSSFIETWLPYHFDRYERQ